MKNTRSTGRYGWYVRHYGEDAWELDAMDPNVLRDRVREEIEGLIDEEAWSRHRAIEAAEQETVTRVARGWICNGRI